MSLGVQGIFGPVPFYCSDSVVQTFRDVKVQHEARYGIHEVIGQTPVAEYIGPAQKKVAFSVRLSTDWGSPPAVWVPVLDTILDSGESYELLLGVEYFGKFYLRSFNEDRKFLDGHGSPIVTDVSLNLEEDKGFNLLQFVKNAASNVAARVV